MGADKATLPFRGAPLLPSLVARLRTQFPRVVIVGGPPLAGAEGWPDDAPAHGPLGGLRTGLRRAGGRCFVVGCDHPLLDATFARWLFDQPGDAVIPRLDGREQPLHAAYGPACLEPVTTALAADQRAMRGPWRAQVDARWLDGPWRRAQQDSLRSANTKEDWAALEGG